MICFSVIVFKRCLWKLHFLVLRSWLVLANLGFSFYNVSLAETNVCIIIAIAECQIVSLSLLSKVQKGQVVISYVYTLRLIGPISYPDECDLMVNPRKYIVIFSRMHFVTFVRIYSNMHQNTKSARLIILVCKRTFSVSQLVRRNIILKKLTETSAKVSFLPLFWIWKSIPFATGGLSPISRQDL